MNESYKEDKPAGFLLVLRPSESAQVVMILLGVTLITEGVLNLITILTAVKTIRHQLPEVIDAEYCEIEQEAQMKTGVGVSGWPGDFRLPFDLAGGNGKEKL